jgi:hypothetical protein
MSTVEEIKTAIQSLSADDRTALIAEIPVLFPELSGDAAWERLIHDPQPRPALSELLDRAQAEYQRSPASCPETSDQQFEREP